MKMCDFLRISQDYGIWHAFLRLKRWAIVFRPAGLRKSRAIVAQRVAETRKFLDDVGRTQS